MPTWAKWGFSLLVAVALIALGWRVLPVLVTLHVLVCFVLVIVIMLQSGNAADLAGAFGGAGSQTAFGPRGAASFLSRATTWCAVVFMMTPLALSVKRAPAEVEHWIDSGGRKKSAAATPERRHCLYRSPFSRCNRCLFRAARRQPRLTASNEECVRRARGRKKGGSDVFDKRNPQRLA